MNFVLFMSPIIFFYGNGLKIKHRFLSIVCFNSLRVSINTDKNNIFKRYGKNFVLFSDHIGLFFKIMVVSHLAKF